MEAAFQVTKVAAEQGRRYWLTDWRVREILRTSTTELVWNSVGRSDDDVDEADVKELEEEEENEEAEEEEGVS